MAKNPLILVEGTNDAGVLTNLLKKNGLNVIKQKDSTDKEDEIVILHQGGYQNLRRNLPTAILLSESSIAIVIDADTSLENRWKSITDKLREIGYQGFPAKPDLEGTVNNLSKSLPKVGIWIMPNNTESGKIENFLKTLVPKSDNAESLWKFAETTIENLPIRLFKEKDKEKAEVASFLAWQSKPGVSMATAIEESIFASNTQEAQNFVDWLKRLFVE